MWPVAPAPSNSPVALTATVYPPIFVDPVTLNSPALALAPTATPLAPMVPFASAVAMAVASGQSV
jgi:hypothetical protein